MSESAPRQVPHAAPRDLAGGLRGRRSRRPRRAVAARRPRPVFRRPLRSGDRHLDPRRVSRSPQHPRQGLYRIGRAASSPNGSAKWRPSSTRESAAYHAGDLTVARTLLSRAVDRGGHSDTAQLFLERLRRSETLPAVPAAAPRHPAPRDGQTGATVWNWAATGVMSTGLAAFILVAARPVASFLAELPLAVPAAVPGAPAAAAESRVRRIACSPRRAPCTHRAARARRCVCSPRWTWPMRSVRRPTRCAGRSRGRFWNWSTSGTPRREVIR